MSLFFVCIVCFVCFVCFVVLVRFVAKTCSEATPHLKEG
jgi:hypothetical protein